MSIDLALKLAPGQTGDNLFFTTEGIIITPAAGAEGLANGSFTSWTGDNPGGWSVSGESGSNPEVTERDANQSHADTKTTGGAANLYSSATSSVPALTSTETFSNDSFFQVQVEISKRISGTLVMLFGGSFLTSQSSVAFTARPPSTTNFVMRGSTAPTDLTVNIASVKALSNLEQLFRHAQPYGDFSVAFTASGNYQAGVVFNQQDASNLARLYFNRLDGKVYLTKRVAGVLTVLGSWTASYSAGKTLTARRYINGTVDAIYDGVTLTPAPLATGLTGLQAGPFLTDASVTISRYTWDARHPL